MPRKSNTEMKSVVQEALANNPKGLANWLMTKILSNLVERVEKGAHLTASQQEWILKAHRTLAEGEIYLGAEEEVDEQEYFSDLPLETLQWLRDNLNPLN